MGEAQCRVSMPADPTGNYDQMVRTLDLLLEEEKYLDRVSYSLEKPYRTQALADLTVNHARAAELLITLWRLQAGE